MNRRGFLKGLAATAAGLLLPADVAAEPERKIWALDRTMLRPEPMFKAGDRIGVTFTSDWFDTRFPPRMTIGDFTEATDPGLLSVYDLESAMRDVWECTQPLYSRHLLVSVDGDYYAVVEDQGDKIRVLSSGTVPACLRP